MTVKKLKSERWMKMSIGQLKLSELIFLVQNEDLMKKTPHAKLHGVEPVEHFAPIIFPGER